MLKQGQVFLLAGFGVLLAMVYPIVIDPLISMEKWRKYRQDNNLAEYEFYGKEPGETGSGAPEQAEKPGLGSVDD